jgi:hypothetical protein
VLLRRGEVRTREAGIALGIRLLQVVFYVFCVRDVSEYENFVVYTVYISTHLLCSVLQLIYVSDIYITYISRMMCVTVIVNCVVRSLNHCAPSRSIQPFREK